MTATDLPLSVPAATEMAIRNSAPAGHRHEQMTSIACSLAAHGFAKGAIIAQCRSMYAEDMPDEEIEGLVEWAVSQDYEPARISRRRSRSFSWRPRTRIQFSPAQQSEAFLTGFRCSQEELTKASLVKVPSDCQEQSVLALQSLYSPEDRINIVTDHSLESGHNAQAKAKPCGLGITMRRDEWLSRIRQHGTPQSIAGAWLRMNPVNGRGIRDANVTSFRYCLLESDSLPEDLQISFLAKLRLPIAMILSSGGRSFHAWVNVNAENGDAYDQTVKTILNRLAPYGWDDANKNPGRLSRLPGARREIGASGDGAQKLVYLNPQPNGGSIL